MNTNRNANSLRMRLHFSTLNSPLSTRRRGVTLLLVLGLMTMFALLVVTFMVVTTQARRASEIAAGIPVLETNLLSGASQRMDTDLAVEALLVGNKELNTPIAIWSILENMYGNPAVGTVDYLDGIFGDGTVSTVSEVTTGVYTGFWTFSNSYLSFAAMGPPTPMDPAPMELAGSVLTIKALGPNTPQELLNKSTRIYLNDNGVIYFVPFEGFSGVNPNSLLNDCTYIINGAPFSGTGPGFDPTNSPLLTGDDGDGTSFALRPNILAPSGSPTYKEYLQGGSTFPVPVLMNPDYTAPDHLNMFLAWFDLQISGSITQINRVIPSFHRPWLVNTSDLDTIRKTVLRPLPEDHPNFTGSNPSAVTNAFLASANGPWDVDNDNDGIPDSIWVDAGLGTYVDPKTNKMYKKLVTYLVRDMDGRLNVNVHGNDVHTNSGFDWGFTTNPGDLSVRGSGYGPAEVRLDLGLNSVNSSVNLNNILQGIPADVLGRHGNVTQPDLPTTLDWLYWNHGIREEAYDGPGVGFYGGIPYDFEGSATVSFDSLGNRIVNTLVIPGGYPYAFNVYAPDGNDNPFLAEQFAAIFQTQGDVNFGFLPTRTRELVEAPGTDLTQTSAFRHHLTPMSSDVPSPSRFLGTDGTNVDWSIYRKVYRIAGTDARAVQLLNLLPEEIRQGLRVNLNRPSLSQYWVTAPGDVAGHNMGLQERAKFAQEIFYLLLVLCYDDIQAGYAEGSVDVITRLAQWSVNLVDFMDPDATMTPFVYSVDPFSDLGPEFTAWGTVIPDIIDGSWKPSGNYRLIWGMEKPEVAITETLATHDRCVADTDTGEVSPNAGGNLPPGQVLCSNSPTCQISINRVAPGCNGTNTGGVPHDKDFDQVKRPQGSLFVELYRCGNSKRSQISPELAATVGSNDLDLAKRSPDASGILGDGDYIWRLAIGEKTRTFSTATDIQARSTTTAKDLFNDTGKRSFQPGQWPVTADDPELVPLDPNAPNLGDHDLMGYDGTDMTNGISTKRYVWFGNDPTAVGCPNLSEAVGRSYWNTGGSGGVALAPDSYLTIGPRSSTTLHDNYDSAPPAASLNLPGNYMIASTSDPDEGVNVSEPMGGYGTVTYPANKPLDGDELFSRGTIPCYRPIFLQRLADPNRPHSPITNPYITIDWNMVDLHVFNSEKDPLSTILPSSEPNPDNPTKNMDDSADKRYAEDFHFASRQWGVNGGGNFSGIQANPWDRNVDFTDALTADLDGKGEIELILDDNYSFGKQNKFWNEKIAAPTPTDPFVHFAWNDSPFANALEVMQVPACSASTFGIQFHDTQDYPPASKSLGTDQRFRSVGTATLGYLLSFEATGLNLARFLEQVHVPSRFAGTIVDWTTDGKPIYSYREPGKINLNTVTESAWKGLKGNRIRFPDYSTEWLPIRGTNFEFPFRSSASALLVPDISSLGGGGSLAPNTPIETTLLRNDQAGTAKFFKTEDSSSPSANMYNEYENAARLSSMTTNRSNVFAVWLTVGYFEVEHSSYGDGKHPSHITSQAMFDAVYPDGYLLGKEKGIDDGTVKRHRAFYLIDRTIPVGFRRGETLNSKDVIIYSRVLE